MSQTVFNKDRYPGLRSFERNQSALFFGREQEIEDIYGLVSTEKAVVFFGKSGLGKSSLLEAGLSPLLEQNGYRPIRIRFSPPTKTYTGDAPMVNLLLCDFMDAFHALDFRQGIIHDQQNPQLWEYIKATTFIDANGAPATPVFIFDQFEEFFYHPKDHQEAFLKQLSEVMHEQPPRRILEWITGIPSGSRTPEQMHWHKQPDVKVIFALRSDKLALMQLFTYYIPGVLRCRYELKPLNRQQAEAAIEMPAKKDLGEGYAPPFAFKKPLLQQIVAELGKGSDEIESSQLQMVCNYIETQVKQQAATAVPVSEETEAIIKPAEDIQKIRNNFYEDQLRLQVPDEAERSLVKRVIEDDLVIEGQRASLLATQLLAKLDGKKYLVDALLKARLIREENTPRGVTYEVSHDTLVPPIEKSKLLRQNAEEELRRAEEWKKAQEERKKLVQEAEERNRLYEQQKQLWQKAERSKRRANKNGVIAGLFAILALAGGIYFFLDSTRETKRRVEFERLNKRLIVQKVELNLLQNLSINLVERLLSNKGQEKNIYVSDTTTTALCLRVLRQAEKIDSINGDKDKLAVIDELTAKLYEQSLEYQADTSPGTGMARADSATYFKKVEKVQQMLNDVNVEEYQKKYPELKGNAPAGGKNKWPVRHTPKSFDVKTGPGTIRQQVQQ